MMIVSEGLAYIPGHTDQYGTAVVQTPFPAPSTASRRPKPNPLPGDACG